MRQIHQSKRTNGSSWTGVLRLVYTYLGIDQQGLVDSIQTSRSITLVLRPSSPFPQQIHDLHPTLPLPHPLHLPPLLHPPTQPLNPHLPAPQMVRPHPTLQPPPPHLQALPQHLARKRALQKHIPAQASIGPRCTRSRRVDD